MFEQLTSVTFLIIYTYVLIMFVKIFYVTYITIYTFIVMIFVHTSKNPQIPTGNADNKPDK